MLRSKIAELIVYQNHQIGYHAKQLKWGSRSQPATFLIPASSLTVFAGNDPESLPQFKLPFVVENNILDLKHNEQYILIYYGIPIKIALNTVKMLRKEFHQLIWNTVA